jgi:hypothetical protein
MNQPLQILSSVGRRASRDKGIFYSRDLSEADLPLLLDPPPVERGSPVVAKLRSTHHNLARLLASGLTQNAVSEMTGYSPSRISVLKGDPAFQELIAYYQSQTAEVFIDAATRLKALGLLAAEELHSRLEEEPEKVTFGQLQELVNSTIGPKAKSGGVFGIGSEAAGGVASGGISLNISFQSPQQTEPGVIFEGKVVDNG